MYIRKKKVIIHKIYRTMMHKSNIFAFIFLLSLQILLVSSQSTASNSSIDNRPCSVDLGCINNSNYVRKNENDQVELRLGNFMCVQNKCNFVVASGQKCREATDCAAYHYSTLHNISLDSDICSSKHCDLESQCDGAWDQTDISSIPKIGPQSACCIGLSEGTECNLVANDVDPCNSQCDFDKETNSSKCFDKDAKSQRKDIWIGVLICLLGSTTLNVGLNIQKYAFTKHQEELDNQQEAMNILNDDNNSIKNSNASITNSIERSSIYRKFEKFMFWKQIIVSPIWVLGLIIYIFGSLLNFVALKFAPQSLVAPLGAVSLVVNLLIAPILHHQKLTKWDILGVIIIIIGSVIITVFSGVVIQDYKLCVLIGLFKRAQTIIYLSVIALFVFALYTFIRVVERNAAQKDEDALAKAIAAEQELEEQEEQKKTESSTSHLHKSIPIINTTNVDTINLEKDDISNQDHVNKDNTKNDNNRASYKLSISFDDDNRKSLTEDINQALSAASLTTTIDNNKSKTSVNDINNTTSFDEIIPTPLPRNSISSIRTTKSVVRQHNVKEKILLPLAYAILASSMATITTLFAKSLINLLTVSITQKDNQFKDLLSWTILLITISTAIGQIYWISMGLKKYDALLQVPIFYCNWSLFDIIGGGIYYDEFHHFGTNEYVGFVVGVTLIFSGVSLLSKRLAKLTKEEEQLKESQKKWEEMKKKKTSIKKEKQ